MTGVWLSLAMSSLHLKSEGTVQTATCINLKRRGEKKIPKIMQIMFSVVFLIVVVLHIKQY